VDREARCDGDPPQIVAASDRIRDTLSLKPFCDDLETIVAHAPGWQRELLARCPAGQLR
jgi:UDP-glucose 4-epimerase